VPKENSKKKQIFQFKQRYKAIPMVANGSPLPRHEKRFESTVALPQKFGSSGLIHHLSQ
jgi:hypothetical protein